MPYRPYATHERLTIPRPSSSPAADPQSLAPEVLALGALGWVLSDPDRAGRLLATTGLTPEALRKGLGDPGTLGAVIDFLCAHEPDLVAAADALAVTPAQLAGAGQGLAR